MSAAGVDQTRASDTPAVLPALLGGLRLLLAPAIAWSVVAGHPLLTLALAVAAALTDLADGRVARLLRQATARGAVLDAVADAAVLVALTTALAVRCAAPAWLAVVVAAREIAWTALVARDARARPGDAARSPHAGLGGGLLLTGATLLATASPSLTPLLRPLAWALIGWGLALAWLVVALRHDDALVVGPRPAPSPPSQSPTTAAPTIRPTTATTTPTTAPTDHPDAEEVTR